jgi:hypothetical protein
LVHRGTLAAMGAIEMAAIGKAAIESISTESFDLYRAAILVCGLGIGVLAWFGTGASRPARAIDALVAVLLVGYCA